LAAMTERVVHAICSCGARPERILRSAELGGCCAYPQGDGRNDTHT
jgi:hypothetical protein